LKKKKKAVLRVRLCDWSINTIEAKSRSHTCHTPALRIDLDGVPTILTTLYHLHHYYIPGSNLLFCGYEVIMDYEVIDDVRYEKIRASMEPFWDLKISKYVDVRISCLLPSLTIKYGWLNFLAYVIPIASLRYIVRRPRPD
jgi:hypothetical protein